jgi:hypothetical protein
MQDRIEGRLGRNNDENGTGMREGEGREGYICTSIQDRTEGQ